ncbi:uncharacterized protein NESG_00889 [Nematocida ausubeli]|uniref:Uncharacterized protein n=1 Tax=Nematocida ausubeli (strain ATCC PRA-371 / ERTm2) TaxID=1913371 RepID=A0A086J3L7_NEMA1|nr:uncharacterized protein NESG_00889 [Nematocida ausubeli]KFG26735.1 hypothetical protein NESG_00889 [Nematocida ausubeli]
MTAITYIFSLGKRHGIIKNMLVLELSKDISTVSMKPVIINSTEDRMEKMNLIAECCKTRHSLCILQHTSKLYAVVLSEISQYFFKHSIALFLPSLDNLSSSSVAFFSYTYQSI